jgi:hypothetical protein
MSSFPLTNSYFDFHIFQDGYCTTNQIACTVPHFTINGYNKPSKIGMVYCMFFQNVQEDAGSEGYASRRTARFPFKPTHRIGDVHPTKWLKIVRLILK